MSRNILISTDVFAAIWARRQRDENTEDEILRRLLGCEVISNNEKPLISDEHQIGFFDKRHNVEFPSGFEIFRIYKRKEFRAIAQNGFWRRLDTNETFTSLNQLNMSIAAGNENVWNGNWKFKSDDGSIKSIAALRS